MTDPIDQIIDNPQFQADVLAADDPDPQTQIVLDSILAMRTATAERMHDIITLLCSSLEVQSAAHSVLSSRLDLIERHLAAINARLDR